MKNAIRYTLVTALFGLGLRLQAASTIQFATTNYTVAENAGTVTLTVQRTNDVDTIVSVDYITADGTATNGLKYTAVSGTLSFGVGETNKDIVVPILNEGFVEGTRTFTVSLSNPMGGAVLGVRATATMRITDNDTGLAFEFANYWVREDEGSVLIGMVRGDDGNFPVTVEYATADSTAKAGEDYTTTAGRLEFAAGEKVKLFTIPILNDGLKEASKAFRLYLTNAIGTVLGTPKLATVSIIDNDTGVQFTQNQLWVQENEGVIRLTVTRGNDRTLDAFSVDFATTNGTATAGRDYIGTNGTLAFAAGEMIQSFAVPILKANEARKDRQFKVLLSNPTGGMALGTAAASVTVCDNREMLPHRFDALRVSPEGTVSLVLGGGFTTGLGLVNRFKPYFDIYPVEVSTNLVDWVPLTWVLRTNADTNILAFADAQARGFAARFYRTPTNPFVVPLPPPTGPFSVGRVDRFVTDPSRRNRNKISTNGSFGITIWYPAKRQAGQIPTPFYAEAVARDPSWWPGWIDRMPSMRTHTVQNAPFAPDVTRCPVVFFSHGWTSDRQDEGDKTENLASHGYITVSVDHFDCSVTVLPDGRYFSDASDTSWRPKAADGVKDRVQDFMCLMRQLEVWNQQDPLLAGRLDLEKVAAIGFSWGGEVAPEFCRIEPRCLAAINLDEFSFSMAQGPLAKPTLTMNHYQSGDVNSDMNVFNSSASPAYWFQISDTEHASFSGLYWYLNRSLASGQEASRTMNAFALWFLNKYLKGSNDPMPALKDYPRVINFKQK